MPRGDVPLPENGPGFCYFRYGISILLHFCNFVMTAQTISLNLTMVSMVNHTDPNAQWPNASSREKMDNKMSPVYDWSPNVQGIILSAPFYGVFVVQIPTGYFSGIYPTKIMIGCAILLCSVLTLCIPSLAQFGPPLLIVCRVAQGMAQGVVRVAQSQIWARWAPPLERGRLTSLSVSGFYLGPSIALLATGFICEHLGWPKVFYIFGTCGCVVCILWFILFYDEPKDHPCLSLSEKDYITSSLTQQVSSSGNSLPIKAMLRSLPLWAIAIGNIAVFWSNVLLTTYSPMFIHTMLHVNIRENGLMSSLSPLAAYIIGILSGHLGDFFLSRNILSLLTIRKLFTTLGTLCPVVFTLCLLYLSFNFESTVVFLILSNAATSFSTSGININALDIAPRYIGFIKGVTHSTGMIGGLISSTITGMMLSQDTESSWYKIFFIMLAVNVTSTIFYLVFAKAEIQDWAEDSQDTHL